MTAEISFKEVKKHKSKKSLWMVIHNDVYDVTKFLEEHPGGEETLLENAGKDASQAFEDVGHSEDARELLKKYKIGTLPAADKRKDIPLNCSPCPSCNLTSNTLKWALLALAGAIVIGIVLKKTMT